MADAPETEQSDETTRRARRRDVLRYSGAAGVAAGLAGCQSPDNPVPGANVRGRGGPIEGGPGGGGGAGEGALAGQTIRIGILAPMNLVVGESMWEAAQLARDEINDGIIFDEGGGIAGANVEVVQGDTETSPGVAQSEHQRLVTEERCHATMGIYLGSGLLQTMPSIANNEKIHITTASADPRAGQLVSKSDPLGDTDEQDSYELYKYHFRAGPIHLYDLADAMYEFMEVYQEDYEWDTAAILSENIAELDAFHERVDRDLNELVDIPITERPGGVSNWAPLYDDLESEDVDLAVIAMALSGTTAVNQWANEERQFEMGGIHVPAQAYEYWEATGGNVEFIFTMNALTPQTANTDYTRDFTQFYIDKWDRVPMYTGPLTFDGMRLFQEAIEKTVEEEELDEIPDSDTIIPYMEDITFTRGTVINEFRFTPPDADYGHEPQWTSMAETGVPVYQQWQFDEEVRDDYGTMHSFAPEQNKTADYQVPDWI